MFQPKRLINFMVVFNMGIGWVAIVKPEDVEAALKAGPGGTVIGTLREGRGIHVKVQGE